MTRTLIIASILVCSSLFSQTPPRPDSTGTVTILTEPSGADLFIDSMYVGKSPILSISLQRGGHRIKAFYPSVFSWNATVTEEILQVADTGNLEKRLVLGTILKIQTDPPGGTVLYDGKSLGVTPLYVRGASSLSGNLIIQKSGYDSLTVTQNEINEGYLRLRLRPVAGFGASLSPGDLRGPDIAATDHWPTYVSGLTMIVSGVTSAYLKDQANREFDRYLVSKNPASLSTTNRLDRGATISLVISQISFVVLSYLLLSE
jgi:hypothetical protein